MNSVKISMIAAMDEKGGIGKNNQLLFKIPEDFERMRSLIKGHVLVMGRKTHDSIARVLPSGPNIVITRDPDYARSHQEGCLVLPSLKEAMDKARDLEGNGEIFIFGGGQIFKQAIGLADKLYLTIVEGDFKADTFFPDYSDFKKKVWESEQLEKAGFKYKFLDLER